MRERERLQNVYISVLTASIQLISLVGFFAVIVYTYCCCLKRTSCPTINHQLSFIALSDDLLFWQPHTISLFPTYTW